MNTWPVLRGYDRHHLVRIAMPLGGIGTGTVSLGGRGNLRDWEMMNRPAKGFVPGTARTGPFFALWVGDAQQSGCARLLEGPLDPSEYDGDRGSAATNAGYPRFGDCRFEVAYPLAQVHFTDPALPVRARLEAFSPLVPADAETSGQPVAILRYVVENRTGRDLPASVCGTVPNFIGQDGNQPDAERRNPRPRRQNRNLYREDGLLRGLFMASEGVDPDDPAWGTTALSTPDAGEVTCREDWARELEWGQPGLDFWDDFAADGRLTPRETDARRDMPLGSLALRKTVPAGGEAAFTFFLTWHFPNRQTWTPVKEEDGSLDPAANRIGNHYCERFADAWAAAAAVGARVKTDEARTVAFVRSLVETDLPREIVEAALFNLSTLRTQTCFRTPDGRLFGFEGCCDGAGCCLGSCTHVWNYEQATAFLFGELARGMRDSEFAHATGEEGCMSFRIFLPLERAAEMKKAAADGQMGCIMKLYREWQLSGDEAMLRRLWPHAKRALSFAWIEHGWDADRDGVMEGCQHNTMDVEYYGPNPQMTGWYLGALRAAAEMARHLGEEDFAAECHRLFASGSAWMDAHLFNGEYYEHHIRPPADPDAISETIRLKRGAEDAGSVGFQLGGGCLVDQLVGQSMAHICGLGYLHDPEKVKATLQSIVRMNRHSGFDDHFNPMRSYALGEETALLMASYPPGARPERPFPYFGEVMTGFEYTAAVGLLQEGLEAAALRIIGDIRTRYDGRKRNPFDEAECGRHYARAMASWGAIPAWTGFVYSAVSKTLSIGERAGTYFWSTGNAWGTYALGDDPRGRRLTLRIVEGDLPLEAVTIGGEPLAADCLEITRERE
jgi:uncharacterized protein (DUF608 family)